MRVANLLLTAKSWTDNNSLSPPAEWNGTSYHFIDNTTFGYISTSMSANIAAKGDVVAFTLKNNIVSTGPDTMTLSVNGVLIQTFALTAIGSSVFSTAPLNAGDTVLIQMNGVGGYPPYSIDLALTPTVIPTNYNCACSNNEFPTRTLAQLRNDLMTRLGFAAMLASPPPGMNGLLDSFLTEAQELLYRRYKVFQGERWFTWSMTAGTRFYDTAQNDDAVNGLLQPPVMGAITTATVGGTLPAGTYGYLVTALNANGETTPGAEVSITTTGSTSTNTINWSADTGSTGYKVYGRTVAGEWFMASIAAGTLTFTDTGAITPSTTISPPDVNTTPACSKTLDPRMVTWVGISQSDNNWRPLRNGINPVRYSSIINAIPDSYEIRQCIEVWPAPPDNTWKLRIKGYFGLMPLLLDNDSTTIDYRAVALLALANAKAHYGQPDANNYAAQLNTLMGDLNAGSHMTRRYVPGQQDKIPTVWPVIAP